MLEERLGSLSSFEGKLDDALTLVELAEAEGDTSAEEEGLAELRNLKAEAERRQIEALLSGEVDGNDTYIEVHAGAGGTESCDWARMLFRMYARWAERHKFKVEIIEETFGEEAGIKSGTLLVKGHNAHGWAKTESGVHRLVRISPFDSNARRHTSFASVWVYPVIDDRIEIDVKESGLPHRHLSLVRRRRPACQHDRFRRSHHPYSDRHRRRLPGRTLAAQEPRDRLEHAARAAL